MGWKQAHSTLYNYKTANASWQFNDTTIWQLGEIQLGEMWFYIQSSLAAALPTAVKPCNETIMTLNCHVAKIPTLMNSNLDESAVHALSLKILRVSMAYTS